MVWKQTSLAARVSYCVFFLGCGEVFFSLAIMSYSVVHLILSTADSNLILIQVSITRNSSESMIVGWSAEILCPQGMFHVHHNIHDHVWCVSCCIGEC